MWGFAMVLMKVLITITDYIITTVGILVTLLHRRRLNDELYYLIKVGLFMIMLISFITKFC